jgi:molybdenum cofactor synthesis domain-containing protein
MLRTMTTAAAIIIGDEILSGKVRDTNAHSLIEMLHEIGVELVRIVTIGDDPATIAVEVNRCRERYDHVITSGGVGPTHDDRTMEGVALAFERDVMRHPELERAIRKHWGDRINDAALKLSEVPTGAGLLGTSDGWLPVVVVENVFILPGIPELFEAKLRQVREALAGGRPWVLHSIYISADESTIASAMTQVVKEIEPVKIGSYPRLRHPDYRVHVTIEAADKQVADQALARLLELLDEAWIVRVERGE